MAESKEDKSELELNAEDLVKAYKNGSFDVRKTLKNLFPNFGFEPGLYPRLMIHRGSGLIVLFEEASKGIVVRADSDHKLNEYGTNWATINFEPYEIKD